MPSTPTKLQTVRKLYFGRRRAKDTVTALYRLQVERADVFIRVFVIESPLPPNRGGAVNADAQIIIDVTCASTLEDQVRGMMALGSPETGNWEPEAELKAEECLEFYQGLSGLSRFRGA